MERFSSILITGASSGVGAALAKEYAARGISLFLLGRDNSRLQDVADACRAKGAQVECYIVDVRDAEGMRLILRTCDEKRYLDLVIANAGISAGLGDETESESQVREVFSVNVDGVLNTVLPVLQWMKDRGKGSVAIMSSVASVRGLPSCPAYSASKMAVRGLGEGLRGAYKQYGITVSVICPGYITTPMTDTNSFPMPFIMSAEKAAKIIRKGIDRSRSRIAFPLALYLPLWLLSCLPVAWTDSFFAALPKKSPLPESKLHDATSNH